MMTRLPLVIVIVLSPLTCMAGGTWFAFDRSVAVIHRLMSVFDVAVADPVRGGNHSMAFVYYRAQNKSISRQKLHPI